MHNSGCLCSVMVPWGYVLGCNWHMQLSLTYSASHDRNAIEHFGSPLVLISSSHWSCIFSMIEMNVRNVKSRVINWESSCHPTAPFAVCIPLLWFDGSLWMICLVLDLGKQVIGNQIARAVTATAMLLFTPEGLHKRAVTWASFLAGWIQNIFPEHALCTKNGKVFQSHVGHCSGHLRSMVSALWSAPDKVKQIKIPLVDIAGNQKPG